MAEADEPDVVAVDLGSGLGPIHQPAHVDEGGDLLLRSFGPELHEFVLVGHTPSCGQSMRKLSPMHVEDVKSAVAPLSQGADDGVRWIDMATPDGQDDDDRVGAGQPDSGDSRR